MNADLALKVDWQSCGTGIAEASLGISLAISDGVANLVTDTEPHASPSVARGAVAVEDASQAQGGPDGKTRARKRIAA